jgi:hypothetical protein
MRISVVVLSEEDNQFVNLDYVFKMVPDILTYSGRSPEHMDHLNKYGYFVDQTYDEFSQTYVYIKEDHPMFNIGMFDDQMRSLSIYKTSDEVHLSLYNNLYELENSI